MPAGGHDRLPALGDDQRLLPPDPPKNVKLFIDGSDHLHVDVRVAGWTEVSRILDEELKGLWDGSQPGRQVAAAIKARVDPVLKAEAQKAGA